MGPHYDTWDLRTKKGLRDFFSDDGNLVNEIEEPEEAMDVEIGRF